MIVPPLGWAEPSASSVSASTRSWTARPRGGGGDSRPELRERGARCQRELDVDEVDTGDLLGHGVLDLEARVRLHEERLSAVSEQKLESADTDETCGAGERAGRLDQAVSDGLREIRSGGELDELLVTALEGAVALPQVPDRAGRIGDDLDLDVARSLDQAFGVERADAESALRFGGAALEAGRNVVRPVDPPHASTAAAGDGLQQDRRLFGLFGEKGFDVFDRCGGLDAGHDGYVPLRSESAGRVLVAEEREGLGRGADEDDAGVGAGPREICALGEEAVAGVEGVAARGLRDTDQVGDVEVGAGAAAGQRHDRFRAVSRREGRVLGGVDGDRFETALPGGAGDSKGDLAPVRDQQASHR